MTSALGVLVKVVERQADCQAKGVPHRQAGLLHAGGGQRGEADDVTCGVGVGHGSAKVLVDMDQPKAKRDEVVQTPVAKLRGRAARRTKKAYAVRAAEIVSTH
jgi:hypothetical protein